MNSQRFRFGLKDLLLTIAGTGLALASLKADDPIVVIPMLVASGLAFVALCVFHEGRRTTRTISAFAIVLLLSLIGWRDLAPKRVLKDNNPVISSGVPESKPLQPSIPAASPRDLVPSDRRQQKRAATPVLPLPKQQHGPATTDTQESVDRDLTARVVNPQSPALILENGSDELIEGLNWELVMFREADAGFFSFPTQSIGYLKPHTTTPSESMSLTTLPMAPNGGLRLREGDSLYGSIAVDCPRCGGSTYIVHFTWGQSGWFYRVRNEHGGLTLPKGMTSEAVSNYIALLESTIKPQDRIPILPQQ